jgi:hypothetical protein
MAEWQSWFARYTHKSIFVGGGPSTLYRQMPVPQHLQYICKVNRTVFLRDKRIVNHSMKDCWDEHDWILPSKYLPSVANVSAGYKAFWRYDKPEKVIPPVAARLSRLWTLRHFQQYMGGARVFPSSLVIREMDKTTSCGYPWNLTYQNKEQMLNDPVMSQVLQDYSNMIRQDYPCGVLPIWTCSVKGGEMRPVEKIRENSLRTFTASPIEHSHATNELCLDMNDKFYNSAGRTWSQVGASKFDGQWDEMYRRLNKHKNAAALDGKQFDASLLAELLWDQMWIRWDMLSVEFKTTANLFALLNVYDSIISSVVVMDMGDLVRKFLGNPSGSANTVVDNTMILFRFMCLAWIILSMERRKSFMQATHQANAPLSSDENIERFQDVDDYGYTTFMSNVEAALYGDDDTFTVSDFVREWFTPKTIAEVWTQLGLTTTADNWEYAQLETLTFLSQSFVMVAGLWMPSPETEKVLGSLYLGSSVDDIRFHLLRAYALRIESWANTECRHKISTYIDHVHQYYRDQLCGEVRGMTMVSIREVWKSDEQILKLYSGEESWAPPPPWRLVGVELNPGPQARTGLIMHVLFKTLLTIAQTILCHYIHTSGTEGLCCVVTFSMTKNIKQKVKKAAKKEAAKEIKKVLRKKGTRRTARTKPTVLHGKGGYFGDLGKRLGGHLGGVADEVVGLGKALTGKGAYHVKQNTVYESGGPPSIVNTKHTSVIRHREFLCDVTGTTSFQIARFPINPGVARTFPWLASIAQGYEQYRVRGMVFEFLSTSATSIGSTNTALGTVIMSTEYNSNLPEFVSKLQMENHEYTTAVCPDHSALHPIECARGRTPVDELYVRTNMDSGTGGTSYPNNYNPLLYDLGQFYIATVGMQASATIGELWVSYEIEFLKPALSKASISGSVQHYFWDSTIGTQPVSGALTQNMKNKNTGVRLTSTNGIGSFAAGRYIMCVNGIQSSTDSTVPAITLTGGSAVAMLNTSSTTGNGSNSYLGIPNGTGALTTFQWMYAFDITNVLNNLFTFGGATIGTLTAYDIFIMPYPSGYTMIESRKAVDWDPFAVVSRRLQELELKLARVEEEEEEKYVESACSTPLHVEPPLICHEPTLTQSTADLAESLLARIGRRNAVTSKTASTPII